MGIKNFHQFVKKHAPHVYKQTHLSEYAGMSVAVDISGLIYKYKILNKDRWLDSFIYLILALRRNRIHPIFVFDGEAPKAKDNEKTKRSQQRKQLTNKVFSLRESLDNYYSTGEANDVLHSEMKKIEGAPVLGNVYGVNTSVLEKRYSQMESQIVHWNESELEDLYKLFTLCGVQYLVSPSEAETFCASLALQGKVSAVISNDSDVCVYGVKKFLYEINGLNETCVEISYDDLLEALKLTPEEFTDFCIMCGCDYNDNIPGVGPMNAYKLIKQYHSIDSLPDSYDKTILNHEEVRELFSTRYDYEDEVLCREPSEDELIELYNFLKLKNSRIKFDTIERAFAPTEIVFEE